MGSLAADPSMGGIWNLSMDTSLNVLLGSGVILGSLALGLQVVMAGAQAGTTRQSPWLSGWHRYLELEMNDLAMGGNIVGLNTAQLLSRLQWSVFLWGLLILMVSACHVFFPLGGMGVMPFTLPYWLGFGACSVIMLPLVSVGWSGMTQMLGHAEFGLRGYLRTDSPVASRHYYVALANGNVRPGSAMTSDLGCVTAMVRGFWSLGNWAYTALYLGFRMWLVFVLHAFCLACFAELYTVACDLALMWAWPIGGLLGIGLFFGLMGTGYLAIQVYVYLSFSLSFLFFNVLGWYRTERVVAAASKGVGPAVQGVAKLL